MKLSANSFLLMISNCQHVRYPAISVESFFKTLFFELKHPSATGKKSSTQTTIRLI